MNASHNSAPSVEAEKNEVHYHLWCLRLEKTNNEIGDMKAYYTVIVDRGGGEITFELLVPLSFLPGFLETTKPQRESKNKICKKTRIIHKNIIRIIKESFKVQMKDGHRYLCFSKSLKCN